VLAHLLNSPAVVYLILFSIHTYHVQVCRRQVYEGSSKAPLPEQRVEKVVRSTNDVLASLFALMLNQGSDSGTVQAEQQRLLRAIDLFFQESSRREQQCVTAPSPPQRQGTSTRLGILDQDRAAGPVAQA